MITQDISTEPDKSDESDLVSEPGLSTSLTISKKKRRRLTKKPKVTIVPIAAKPKRIQPLDHSIRMIRAVLFRLLVCQPELQVFSITIRDIIEEQKRTDKPKVDIDPIDILEEY
jgi:hypothetical protein